MPATTTSDSAAMWARLRDVAERFHEIEREMADPATSGNPSRLQTLAREHSSLQGKINLLNEYQSAADQLQQARDVLDEADDDEMRELALSEVTELREQIEQLEEAARRALLPRDPNDDRNVIVEIRAGAGGDEAGLWAADLLRAYVRY
ncbi:MAG: PCRF domain-containing protein, partial [Chloroflexi bacterium]|nr:PCRF domain-containing protein [Chloroflexota bacterium]